MVQPRIDVVGSLRADLKTVPRCYMVLFKAA